jgi:hypothetical protein
LTKIIPDALLTSNVIATNRIYFQCKCAVDVRAISIDDHFLPRAPTLSVQTPLHANAGIYSKSGRIRAMVDSLNDARADDRT